MSEDFISGREAHFNALYRSNPDPWNYLGSSYEQEKYRATMDILPDRRFRSAIEAGCSIGVLTEMIADRADRVTGIDLSERAIAVARERLAGRSGVTLICGTVPADWPNGRFDLIVLSEFIYYLSQDEIRALCERLSAGSLPGAKCLMVNWTGDTGSPWTGRQAAEEVMSQLAKHIRTTDHKRIDGGMFVIDLLTLG